ncbi:hypothetical protein QLQ12_02475 [Actinoplanes sp. NEAU-A12]|uniref:Uncharacterized protein n=1 Tax=Actinoplanes sandaracinus TaxID=3045177 RepID=A0ABT6WCM7_9ACTN|nr:hypothetical protein [Actinoplanes sandaracinus]MDI6097464.1 hypothetical protein [Actinoplanes sandaracinus]
MLLEIEENAELVFDDGSPVRAASAIAAFGDGWLVVQDDATHAAWWRPGSVTPVRVADPVGGLEVFSSAAGTKHLKPDFEAACAVPGGGVLLLGSGSSPARTRVSLVRPGAAPVVADLRPAYQAVAAALGLREDQLNLEGACLIGDRLRWFQRGNPTAGTPTACVDLDVAALLAAVHGDGPAEKIDIEGVRRYDLGAVAGVALAVTDAVALADGRVLVSAAAEDTPNAIDDGPVTGSALALLDDDGPVVVEIPGAAKVEGLAVRETTAGGVRLHAVVDADDPDVPSRRLGLRLRW